LAHQTKCLLLKCKACNDREKIKKNMNYTTISSKTNRRNSVPLGKDELNALKLYRKTFDTEVDCAIKIGIDRTVLNRVLLTGSGSPKTIERIRVAIGYFGLSLSTTTNQEQ
jgi:predicted DNA-binding protein (UPF0251 family)